MKASYVFEHLVFLGLVATLSSCCAGPKKPIDAENQTAIAANDYTGLIEGCGHQLNSGFISCRKTEGSASDEFIYFVGPKSDCDGTDPCITFKIFSTTGEPTFSGSIKRNETRAAIAWRDLLKRDTFQIGDRGFWGYSYSIRYKDPQTGQERKAYSQGEIYLRVLKKDYTSLQDMPVDPAFFWEWNENGTPVKLTTGMRTYVGQAPKAVKP